MFGHEAVIHHLRDWCAEGLKQGPGRVVFHGIWQRHFAAKLAEQETEHSNQGLFGMSSAAGCLRANALRRAGVPGTPATGDDRVTWETGHQIEVFALAVLEASGFKLAATQARAVIPGVFSSAADAVLADGPVKLPYPLVLSVKSRAYKMGGKGKRRGFAGLGMDGIYAAEPAAWVQAQLEMQALGLDSALVLVVAKDVVKAYEGDPYLPSLAWYAELVSRAEEEALRPVILAHKITLHEEERQEHGTGAFSPISITPITFWPNGNGVMKAVRLPDPGNVKDVWGGENQKATGRFNPCFSCQYSALCRGGA